jgi:hypothetical protein
MPGTSLRVAGSTLQPICYEQPAVVDVQFDNTFYEELTTLLVNGEKGGTRKEVDRNRKEKQNVNSFPPLSQPSHICRITPNCTFLWPPLLAYFT